MRQRHNDYEYEVLKGQDSEFPGKELFYYEVYTTDSQYKFWVGDVAIRESNEWYFSEDFAEEGAKRCIIELEQGEDQEPDNDYCAPTIDWNERRLLGE